MVRKALNIENAYRIWLDRYYGFAQIETELEPYMCLAPNSTWLKKMRQLNFLSIRKVARRLGISNQAYSKMENNEDRLSVAKLRACARTLDCELVYAIVPRTRISRKIWDSVCPAVQTDSRLKWVLHPDHVLAKLVANKMYDPEFRFVMGWSQNTRAEAYESARNCKVEQNIRNWGRKV